MSTRRGPWWLDHLVKQPSVVVLNEKHGDRYFHAPDDEALGRVALHILRERMDEGCWYHKPEKPEGPGFTKEQMEALPDALKPDAKRKWAEYVNELRRYEYDNEWFLEAEKALAERDGRLAWKCLKDRAGGEYEYVKLERYEEVKGP